MKSSQAVQPVTGGPFSIMRRLFDDLERLIGVDDRSMSQTSGAMFVPSIDVRQEGDRVIVHADLPGMAPDDVQLRIEDRALVIQGERRSEQQSNERGIWRRERSYGQFRRVIPLPEGADAESADARFENGVLEVSVKAPPRQRGRQIEIKTGPKESEGMKH